MDNLVSPAVSEFALVKYVENGDSLSKTQWCLVTAEEPAVYEA